MKYAKDNRLEIALKPKDFPFETPEEIKREDSEADLYSRKVYQDTRDYYIIKEQKSGKMP